MTQTLMNTTAYSTIQKPYPAGFDGGNAKTCMTIIDEHGASHTVSFPSNTRQVVTGRGDLLSSVMETSRQEATDYYQHIDITYRGRRYLVGYSALRQDKESSTRCGDESRYTSTEQIVRLLAASGLLVREPEYTLELMLTVPLKYFSDQLRRAVRDAISGRHEFMLNGEPRVVTINVRKVLFEGLPGITLYGAATANARRLIVDGGFYTTEFIMMNGREVVDTMSQGYEVGVQRIADYLYEKVKELHNRRLTTQELTDVIRAYGSRKQARPLPYPVIPCGTHILDSEELTALVKTGAGLLVNELVDKAGSLWGTVNGVVAGDVAHQYFLGGMPYFIADELKERMPFLQTVASCGTANADGCAHLAYAWTLKNMRGH